MGELDGMGCFQSGVYRNRYRTYESFYDTIYAVSHDAGVALSGGRNIFLQEI